MTTEFVLPHIGSRPIHKVTPAEVLAAMRPIEARAKHETAHRTKQYVGQIFRYAVGSGRARYHFCPP
ncbi:phage integrase central domain-containing protein [Steroidobacter cummioxidans]|uniref:phage integrase central domain-containing protein n=1 Tax=Steroidobacter cummioxidans TaxID=1803913 RepID=UPI0039C92315